MWGRRRDKGRGISLLVPFRGDGGRRSQNWEWLREFWAEHLPGAEVVVGSDRDCDPDGGVAFSKAAAVNDAASRARGDVFAIVDADCYIRPEVVVRCAEQIRQHRRRRQPLWFVPYRKLRRLTEDYSDEILRSEPEHPIVPPEPPRRWMVDQITECAPSNAHYFAAMIMVMPREAFFLTHGMDERFRSWSAEDVSFRHAVDTLYGRHRTTDNPVWHLWHPNMGATHTERVWEGGVAGQNDWLAQRYVDRIGNPMTMRHLVDEPHDL